ncbi:hypothetical protein ABBQ32_002720 [Trebouxia sp. C0010 RCD-2024]
MSRQFDAGTIQGFWTDIQKATLAQSAQPATGQVAQRVQQLPNTDSPDAQAARSALLASLTAAGLISQTGFPMYPPPQFDSGNLTPQALSRVDDMLPIGAQQLQQAQSANQLQASAGRIDSAEAVTAQLPIVQPPVPHASGSESDDDARGRTAAANGDRKSQLKEKNRKAQKRFRERQKSKLAESEDKVAAMTVQLEQLHADRVRLENRNSVLEKVLEMKEIEETKPSTSSSGPVQFEVAHEAGQEVIDKFRLQQGLLLTVRPEQPISLSIDQLRRLSWEEHAGVWRDYVNALAQCLVLANGDVNSPALERMSQLVQECLSLSAGVAVANPRGSFTFHSLKMDAASPTAAAQAPGQDFWERIVKELQLSPEIRQDIKLARRAYLTQLGFIIRERKELIRSLEDNMPNASDHAAISTRFLQSLDISTKLHQNMQQQHSCLLQFTMTVALRIADKFHGAILIVQSFPWSPDVLSIVNIIANEDSEPSAEVLLGDVSGQQAIEGKAAGEEQPGRAKVAIALESCVMEALHNKVFQATAQLHRAEDIALHAFLEQLLAGKVELHGTSPNVHAQDSTPGMPSSAGSRHQQPAVALAGEAVPLQVWQLCGVPPNLQATGLVDAADALLQLDSVQCPLEVVTCLQHADQAIAQAVGQLRKQDRSIGPMSSDSLLPLFIAALIVGQPLHLHACLDYVKCFHLYGDWAGQTGFQAVACAGGNTGGCCDISSATFDRQHPHKTGDLQRPRSAAHNIPQQDKERQFN